ncbi:MAG TPA: peptidoglycan-associated lipoprotein Pal [Oceanospirillaceae bacterium]|nr:peptidoglycan-associated lipoprotein Pal [Oceanospirillaceae bacterium]
MTLLAACSNQDTTTDSSASTQGESATLTSAVDAQAIEDANKAAEAAEQAAIAAQQAQEEAAAQAAAETAAQAAAQAAADAEAVAHEQSKEATKALAHIIYFDFDQSTIRAEYREVLNGHAAFLAQNPGARIVLEGHADERGTREYNMALGERRGNSVSRYLVVQGVSVDAIEVVSFGEERPVNEGHDDASWSENRRVEIRYATYQ